MAYIDIYWHILIYIDIYWYVLTYIDICILSYNGQKGEHLVRSLRKDMHGTLSENVQVRICYTDTKLGTKFNII